MQQFVYLILVLGCPYLVVRASQFPDILLLTLHTLPLTSSVRWLPKNLKHQISCVRCLDVLLNEQFLAGLIDL
jgi:hypothetical protein